jgi:hypothetical protein
LIYVNTSKQVGDPEHLKVFAGNDAAQTWLQEIDPEGERVFHSRTVLLMTDHQLLLMRELGLLIAEHWSRTAGGEVDDRSPPANTSDPWSRPLATQGLAFR